jgi:lipopolysaccharide transport system ATP-binding protein
MSNDIAIRVESLGKMFRIGSRQAGYKTFRDTVAGMFKRNDGTRKSKSEPFWALKDLSFEIKRGEVVGVIGRNGAGKSTLLKILSRITEPTEGFAEIHGRVGSLLEVGTGFHPELTGRENVFLNGAILGMQRAEIEAKFDEIVAFAEVEKFMGTPVKHYSSGMYLRLAFAVAANLETEILLVDEVLAVGDAAFQKKCLGKMEDASKQGRTVLFVSHNMHAVRRLCARVIMLEAGTLVLGGPAQNVVDFYLNKSADGSPAAKERDIPSECRGKAAYLTHWRLEVPTSGGGRAISRGPLSIVVGVRVIEPLKGAFFGIAVWTEDGTLAWAANSHDGDGTSCNMAPGEYDAAFLLDALPLRPGTYNLETSLNSPAGQLDHWYAVPPLTLGHGNTSLLPNRWRGLVEAAHTFSLRRKQEPTC